MEAPAARLDLLDLVHHVAAFDDLSKHAVPERIRSGGAEVQEIVVAHVDEELSRRRMRVGRARHRHGIGVVLQAVAGFVADRLACGFLLHAGLKPAALDHESIDHTVEHGIVIEAVGCVLQEVLDGVGRLFVVEFDDEVTEGRL